MFKILSKTFMAFSFLLAAGFVGAESFRVRKAVCVNLPGDSLEEQTVTIGINDSVAVFMPKDLTYVEGLELKVQIPASVADWRDSVAFSVYDGIKPVPNAGQIDYSGNKIFVTPLPAKLTWIVQVPFFEKTSIKSNDYIYRLNVIPEVKNGYTFFRFQPAMKGVPEETILAQLNISVKPLLINKGTMHLDIKTPDGKEGCYDVLVDDEPVVLKKAGILLTPGNHSVNVQSEEYRNEVHNVYIEQAKTTNVSFNLKSAAPTLLVTAPGNSQVFLDDQPFTDIGKEIVVTEGDHRIRCVMGGYEVVRSVNVLKGKSYTANLTVDLDITEE